MRHGGESQPFKSILRWDTASSPLSRRMGARYHSFSHSPSMLPRNGPFLHFHCINPGPAQTRSIWPYSLVRHPGYAACIPLTAGIILVHLDHLPSFGAVTTPPLVWKLESWFNLMYILGRVIGLNSLLMRADVEDSLLREHCGKEWVAFSKEVPDKFIPHFW